MHYLLVFVIYSRFGFLFVQIVQFMLAIFIWEWCGIFGFVSLCMVGSVAESTESNLILYIYTIT